MTTLRKRLSVGLSAAAVALTLACATPALGAFVGSVTFSPNSTVRLKLDPDAGRGTFVAAGLSLYCQDGSNILSPQLATDISLLEGTARLEGATYARDSQSGDRFYIDVEGKRREGSVYRGTTVVIVDFADPARSSCSAEGRWKAAK